MVVVLLSLRLLRSWGSGKEALRLRVLTMGSELDGDVCSRLPCYELTGYVLQVELKLLVCSTALA